MTGFRVGISYLLLEEGIDNMLIFPPTMLDRTLSIAPMLDCADRHDRYCCHLIILLGN